MSDNILDLIDGAIDHCLTDDAMRWIPPETQRPQTARVTIETTRVGSLPFETVKAALAQLGIDDFDSIGRITFDPNAVTVLRYMRNEEGRFYLRDRDNFAMKAEAYLVDYSTPTATR